MKHSSTTVLEILCVCVLSAWSICTATGLAAAPVNNRSSIRVLSADEEIAALKIRVAEQQQAIEMLRRALVDQRDEIDKLRTAVGNLQVDQLARNAPLSAPAPGLSGCDLEGTWVAAQSNGQLVTFALTQSGQVLHGTASVQERIADSALFIPGIIGTLVGAADGFVAERKLSVNVYWQNGRSTGVYEGTVGADGHLNGTTHDQLAPAMVATWQSNRGFACQ
jgi:uncharacterized coiled-coil protein SlyX